MYSYIAMRLGMTGDSYIRKKLSVLDKEEPLLLKWKENILLC